MGGKKIFQNSARFCLHDQTNTRTRRMRNKLSVFILIVRRTIRFFVVKNTSHKNALSSVNDLGEKMEALLCRIQSESRSLFIVLVKDRVNYF